MSFNEKIRKMLALAERAGTEAEAQTAFNKAQEIILKYGYTEQKKDQPVLRQVIKQGRVSVTYISLVATVVEHFPVELIRRAGGGRSYIEAMGYEDDVNNFAVFMESLYSTGMVLMEKAFIKHRVRECEIDTTGRAYKERFKRTYFMGFSKGVSDSFKVNEEEKGLIVISPNAVLDEHKKATDGGKAYTARYTTGNAGREQGYNDGFKNGRRRSIQ